MRERRLQLTKSFDLLLFTIGPHLKIVRPLLFAMGSQHGVFFRGDVWIDRAREGLTSLDLFFDANRLHLKVVRPLQSTLLLDDFVATFLSIQTHHTD